LSTSRLAWRADLLAHDSLLSAGAARLKVVVFEDPVHGRPVTLTAGSSVAAMPEAVLRGTDGDDVITPTLPAGGPNTTAGNDTVKAQGGDDLVDGGGGDDALDGGLGNDTLLGGDGNDRLATGDGFNVAAGGAGDDTIVGSNQDDAGGYYDDTTGNYYQGLDGGAGNDSIDAGAGDDRLYGGDGADTLRGADGNDTLSGGYDFDADRLEGGAGNDEISAYSGDRAYGGSGNDTLFSDSADVLLNGGAGDDSLQMLYPTNGRIVAGEGNDTVYVESYSDNVADGFNLTVDAGSGNDLIELNATRIQVRAGLGDDVIVMNGDGGAARAGEISTGAGSDLIRIGRSVSFVTDAVVVTDFQAGSGGDRLNIEALVSRLSNYDGSQPFTSGRFRLVAEGSDVVIEIDQDGPSGPGGWVGVIRLAGVPLNSLTPDNFDGSVTPFIDTTPRNLSGTNGDDTLIGADGGDTLRGLAGADFLDGGFGGNDSLAGGDGMDVLLAGADGSFLSGDNDEDVLIGRAGNDTLLGGDGDDAGFYDGFVRGLLVSARGLTGGAGDDSLDGGLGNDVLRGGSGRDTLMGGDGDDQIWTEGSFESDDGQADVARAGVGNDTIFGGTADSLYGGVGDDLLSGNVACAVIDGGAGRDTLSIGSTVLPGGATPVRGFGGEGDDTITGVASGSAEIDGGLGSDSFSWVHYSRGPDDNVTLIGNGGNDSIAAIGEDVRIVAGLGNDTVSAQEFDYFDLDTSLSVELGDGRDTVVPSLEGWTYDRTRTVITVQDFSVTGASADRIDLASINRLLGLPDDADPFATGQARLMRVGSGTLLEVQQPDGFGGSGFHGVLVLENVVPTALTAASFVQPVVPKIGTNAALPDAGADRTVLVPENGSEVALNLGTPRDPDGGSVTIRIERKPGYDSVFRADGTPVYEGDVLTAQEFAGLTYTVPYDSQGGSAGTLRYSVTDNEGSTVVRKVDIQITPVPDAPTLYVDSQSYVPTGSSEFRLDLDDRVADPDSDSADLTFSVTAAGGGALPRWLTFDAVTHELYGTSPYGESRDIELAITVTDDTGLSDQGNLTLSAQSAYLAGSEGADVLSGTALDDYLSAGDGNDRLDGRAGADQMYGGTGDDVYVVDNVGDQTGESFFEGSDEVRTSVSWTLSANTERLVLTGHAALNGTGNAEANTIIGNDAANRLSGAEGADTLVGGAGDDTLIGGAQADWFRLDGTPSANGIDRIVDVESGFGRDVIDIAAFFGRSGGSVLDGDLTGGDAFDAFTAPAAIQGQHVIALEDALGSTPSTGDIEALLRGFTFDNGSKQAFVVHDTTTSDGYLFYAQDRAGDGNAGIQSNELTLVAELDFAKGRTFDGLDAANFRTSESAASDSALARPPASAAPAADNLHAWFGAHETSLMQPFAATMGLEMPRLHEMY
jgi:Ca2+-binding RTX toxin-like protein